MSIYEESLEYHSRGRKGKIEVVPTKPVSTQQDLSLAYSPGVAEPCRMIAEKEELVYEYTAKGNLVAVVSNGTAVLGLGDIGACGLQARDGRQRHSLQEIRRHRRFRHRAQRQGSRRRDPRLRDARADFRRHQPRGHQGARVLLHRRRAQEDASKSRFSTTTSTARPSSAARRF